MSSARKKHIPLRKGPGRAILRLHRRIGVALSAVFLVICFTGILLNHNVDLDLSNKRVDTDWIYDWYGIRPKGDLMSFEAGEHRISHLSGTLYFDTTPINQTRYLIGVETLDNFHVVATDSALILVSTEGELIETLSSAALPNGDIIGIHKSVTGSLALETSNGFFLSDNDFLVWNQTEPLLDLTANQPTVPNPEMSEALIDSFRGEGLSWNRVVLDIHSGRFFGSLGKWVADISALGLIILTLSGIFYTTKYLRKARERALSK